MKKEIQVLKQTRHLLLKIVDRLDQKQLRVVPVGFKNNVMWHMGHVAVTQQLLCYALSGLPMRFDTSLVEAYRKGTSPLDWQEEPDFAPIKSQFLSSIDDFATDYEAGKFQHFTKYETSFDITLGDIGDAVRFNNMHEGVHLGYVMAMLKNV